MKRKGIIYIFPSTTKSKLTFPTNFFPNENFLNIIIQFILKMSITNNIYRGYLLDNESAKGKAGEVKIYKYDAIHGKKYKKLNIKSLLGKEPIIFKGDDTTNITYNISDASNSPITDEHLFQVNSINTGHTYIQRIARLLELGYKVEFNSYDDDRSEEHTSELQS